MKLTKEQTAKLRAELRELKALLKTRKQLGFYTARRIGTLEERLRNARRTD